MRRLIFVLALIGAWLWWRGNDRVSHDNGGQAAVLSDGFAFYDGHRVTELDRKGTQRKQHAFARDGEVRIIGTPRGPEAGFIESKKVKLVRVSTGTGTVWGKSVRMLCEGVATNDERFAVGWLEADDSVWFVHGDTRAQRTEADVVAPDDVVAASEPGIADPKTWCGIASAHDLVALFWRGRDRLLMQTCTRKKCSNVSATIAFDRNETLLGFGCLRNVCLLAARDRSGKARLQLVTEAGSTKWKKPLETDKLEVSIVGAGDNAFAVGYSTDSASEVLRVDRKGTFTKLWQGPPSPHAPALAWSRDQLLVGHPSGSPTLVAFPR
ncbi:MAG TPA: hypothetical protein VIV11_18745 [Kofleriaceae bacterium]